MANDSNLLVVDDEQLYCEACRRIFSRQGFRVDQSSDAGQGLDLAKHGDYSAILLDIKMPSMDGMEFLAQLRTEKPDVPVILMTGFPSVPGAASAVRLRASDYVTKPFTPEEITQAVHKLIGQQSGNGAAQGEKPVEPWEPRSSKLRFFGESWLQMGGDGTGRAGALISKSQVDKTEKLTVPRIGEAVYQGLPLAALTDEDGNIRSIPAPISGVVIAVNTALADDLEVVCEAACDRAWIACIAPTRAEEQLDNCRTRSVILVNADSASTDKQFRQLTELGCEVRVAAGWDDLAPMLAENDCPLVVLDEVSFGADGPLLAERINEGAPDVKLLVLAAPGSQWETAYRERKIFYYAVEPFADNEIVDILHAAFCPEIRSETGHGARRDPSEPVSGIHIKNHNGRRVCLLTPYGTIRTNAGLGLCLRQKLLETRLPIETYLGESPLTPSEVLGAAKTADRVFIMLVKDHGRIPGCMIRDAKGEFGWASGDNAEKVTVLAIQPDQSGEGLAGLAPSTIEALAGHIAEELASA